MRRDFTRELHDKLISYLPLRESSRCSITSLEIRADQIRNIRGGVLLCDGKEIYFFTLRILSKITNPMTITVVTNITAVERLPKVAELISLATGKSK